MQLELLDPTKIKQYTQEQIDELIKKTNKSDEDLYGLVYGLTLKEKSKTLIRPNKDAIWENIKNDMFNYLLTVFYHNSEGHNEDAIFWKRSIIQQTTDWLLRRTIDNDGDYFLGFKEGTYDKFQEDFNYLTDKERWALDDEVDDVLYEVLLKDHYQEAIELMTSIIRQWTITQDIKENSNDNK